MDGQGLKCQAKECPATPPSHLLQRVSAPPPPACSSHSSGEEGLSTGLPGPVGAGRDPAAPQRQFLAPGFHSRCLLCWLPRTARGPGRPRLQPGSLAPPPPPGLGARPAGQTLHPHTSQRRRPGFGWQLPVVEEGLGPPHPHPLDPRSAHHHVMTLHLRLLAGQLVTFELQAEEQEERRWGLG